MSLVHGMLAGADSVDDMNVPRAGVDRADPGAPGDGALDAGNVSFGRSPSGTSASPTASSITCSAGRGRQGAGPGEAPLVIDIDSFVGEVHGYQKQGACYGVHQEARVITRSRPTRGHWGRGAAHPNRKGKANTQRGIVRFLDELIARWSGAGAHRHDRHPCRLRALKNHKAFGGPPRARGILFSIGVKLTKTHPRADRADPQGPPGDRR